MSNQEQPKTAPGPKFCPMCGREYDERGNLRDIIIDAGTHVIKQRSWSVICLQCGQSAIVRYGLKQKDNHGAFGWK